MRLGGDIRKTTCPMRLESSVDEGLRDKIHRSKFVAHQLSSSIDDPRLINRRDVLYIVLRI